MGAIGGIVATLCAAAVAAAPAGADNDAIGYPVFAGSADPVPDEPVRHRTRGMMRAIYEAERHGTDFWMDRLLARRGDDPAGDWLLTRGRALFMKEHDPETIGFGGQVAYWESIDNRDAYEIELGDLEEVVDAAPPDPELLPGHVRGRRPARGGRRSSSPTRTSPSPTWRSRTRARRRTRSR